MLEIIDINSSADNLAEIVELKKSFRNHLPNVSNGSVLIINNFPAHQIMKYLIIINIEKTYNNYLKIEYNGSNHYIDNLIIGITYLEEYKITKVDNSEIHSGDSTFDYYEANKTLNKQLKKFLNNFENTQCHTLIHICTNSEIQHSSPELIINKKLTAQAIIASFVCQQLKRNPETGRIRAFTPEITKELNTVKIQNFAEKIIESSSENFTYGILTRRKLELIANKKNKIVDDINENLGRSINIVTGKAGTGKTVYLAKAIYRQISKKRRARFLTFNHLLVKDLKCTLRGYGTFTLTNFSSSTIHQYFFKLCKDMGINLILGEERVNELIEICSIRFDKFKPTYDKYKNRLHFTKNELFKDVTSRDKDKSNYNEFLDIAKYFTSVRDFRNWDNIKSEYLKHKRAILLQFVGREIFIEDYPKVLETLYMSITDTRQFYEKFNICNRYDLLAFIYNVDTHLGDRTIPYENIEKQVLKLRRSANWSYIFVDEAQDCEQYEKEILFELRGPENMVIASGGKEQLIRTSGVRLWNASNGQRIPSNINKLYGKSYRQKENIIEFINLIASEYAINMHLTSHTSSKGVGKIILDLRSPQSNYDFDQVQYLMKYGKINECSRYESLMIFVSPSYIEYKSEKSFKVDTTDHITKTNKSIDRNLKDSVDFAKHGINIWSGVAENKSELQVPFQDQVRIISYDSCRGLEAWSVMCLDLDGFIESKRNSNDANTHLADDLFLSEDERRDKYALTWLIMAFTRPMDTLYLDLRKRESDISKKIVSICRNLDSVEILE